MGRFIEPAPHIIYWKRCHIKREPLLSRQYNNINESKTLIKFNLFL
ncbi:hypothetical protein VCRA2119O147_1880008 [Vibrio crassostreae]|nr:hypothetical protein VCRA2119O147_1880008 [Vibrio crassostreae]CAK2338299.1 hypothetical protein VCRA2116O141_30168 [Vibrio crassostreae]